ncbi:MAG: MOSC domain-containing protein, partial [Pseudomonadota bacterium]
EDNRFVTQREHAALARIIAEPTPGGLRLSFDGEDSASDMGAFDVPFPGGADRAVVEIWGDQVDASASSVGVAEWLSDALGFSAKLFFMDDTAERVTSEKWAARRQTSFADAFPLLIANTASLDALNDAIVSNGGAAVPMARFRPNIVIETDIPWHEDFWARVDIGGIEIDVVKPCDRCVVTTKDQLTGASMGKEPLKTLATMRRSGDPRVDGVLFGWNAAANSEGILSVGDEVSILEPRPDGWPLKPAAA